MPCSPSLVFSVTADARLANRLRDRARVRLVRARRHPRRLADAHRRVDAGRLRAVLARELRLRPDVMTMAPLRRSFMAVDVRRRAPARGKPARDDFALRRRRPRFGVADERHVARLDHLDHEPVEHPAAAERDTAPASVASGRTPASDRAPIRPTACRPACRPAAVRTGRSASRRAPGPSIAPAPPAGCARATSSWARPRRTRPRRGRAASSSRYLIRRRLLANLPDLAVAIATPAAPGRAGTPARFFSISCGSTAVSCF